MSGRATYSRTGECVPPVRIVISATTVIATAAATPSAQRGAAFQGMTNIARSPQVTAPAAEASASQNGKLLSGTWSKPGSAARAMPASTQSAPPTQPANGRSSSGLEGRRSASRSKKPLTTFCVIGRTQWKLDAG